MGYQTFVTVCCFPEDDFEVQAVPTHFGVLVRLLMVILPRPFGPLRIFHLRHSLYFLDIFSRVNHGETMYTYTIVHMILLDHCMYTCVLIVFVRQMHIDKMITHLMLTHASGGTQE